MRQVRALVCAFGEDEGQTLVEYSLIILFVALALVGALGLFQGGLANAFSDIRAAIP